MGSLEEANRFVSCVMNRYHSDTVMSSGHVLLIILAPLIALIYGALVMAIRGITDDSLTGYLGLTVVILFIYLLTLMMYLSYRRLIDHAARDEEWRGSLTRYARECGCDTLILSELECRAVSKDHTRSELPAIILLIVFFAAMVLIGCYSSMFDPNANSYEHLALLVVIGYLIAMAMFVLIFLHVVSFPYKHEKCQIDFTKEFSLLMSEKGVHINVMPSAVGKHNIVVSVILFLITGGIYSQILMIRTYLDANRHLMNQWEYETELMGAIITNEGGAGIQACPRKVTEDEI